MKMDMTYTLHSGKFMNSLHNQIMILIGLSLALAVVLLFGFGAFVLSLPPKETINEQVLQEPVTASTRSVVSQVPIAPVVEDNAIVAEPIAAQQNLAIQIANQSGVSGYDVGIFGSGFGSAFGSVTILGVQAPILHWTDTFIRVTIPNVEDGVGELVVTAGDAGSTSAPFTVYTIDPQFLEAPTRFLDIAHDKEVHIDGLEEFHCIAQPENENEHPSDFLTNYRCGYSGLTRLGSASFTADSSRNQATTLAIDLEQVLEGEYYFQLYTNTNWYPRLAEPSYIDSFARDYVLQVSADSTNGTNGSWTDVFAVTDNNRSTRLHKFTVPAGGYTWLRMYVSDGIENHTEASGNDFALRSIHVYKPLSGSTEKPESFVLFGDSLTADAFELTGPQGFANRTRIKRVATSDTIFTAMGLSGNSSYAFVDDPDQQQDIFDAFETDNIIDNARYWGLAFGTNDAQDGSAGIDLEWSNIAQYYARTDAIIEYMLDHDLVPILARIPDTIDSINTAADFGAKQKVLSDIDALAAKHRLIPGPDFYTVFRLNIEEDDGDFFASDGTHHDDNGRTLLVEMWAEAYARVIAPDPNFSLSNRLFLPITVSSGNNNQSLTAMR